jgi:hypothetical protein
MTSVGGWYLWNKSGSKGSGACPLSAAVSCERCKHSKSTPHTRPSFLSFCLSFVNIQPHSDGNHPATSPSHSRYNAPPFCPTNPFRTANSTISGNVIPLAVGNPPWRTISCTTAPRCARRFGSGTVSGNACSIVTIASRRRRRTVCLVRRRVWALAAGSGGIRGTYSSSRAAGTSLAVLRSEELVNSLLDQSSRPRTCPPCRVVPSSPPPPSPARRSVQAGYTCSRNTDAAYECRLFQLGFPL